MNYWIFLILFSSIISLILGIKRPLLVKPIPVQIEEYDEKIYCL